MFRNLKIGKKLTVVFAVIVLIFVIVSAVAVINLRKVAYQLNEFEQTAHTASVLVWTARRDIRLLELSIYQIITTGDQNLIDKYKQQVDISAKSYRDSLTKIKGIFKNTTLLDETLSYASDANPIREKVIKASMGEDKTVALKIMTQEYLPIVDDLVKIGDQAALDANNFVDEANNTANSISLLLFGIVGASVLFIIIVSTILTKAITKPLAELEHAASELANGNLKSQITYCSKDEVGSVAESMRNCMSTLQSYIGDIGRVMNEMANGNFDLGSSQPFIGDFKGIENSIKRFIGEMSITLSQINIAADQVSNGANQVSNSAQALAQGATEQASAVEELSASIIEITEHVNKNAGNATTANEMANNATESVGNCNDKMQNLMRAMTDINAKSSEISKIIKTIEDIAFQTNILALNAAVEAARAGQAGKGFAVVADEVRNLATKSSEAAKNTTSLIEDSVLSINAGVKLADETAKELLNVVDGAKATTMIIADITKATNEQASSLSQVSIGVDQISAVVQTNSATSEESAAASEELSSQASLLKEIISKFKIKNVGSHR